MYLMNGMGQWHGRGLPVNGGDARPFVVNWTSQLMMTGNEITYSMSIAMRKSKNKYYKYIKHGLAHLKRNERENLAEFLRLL